MPTTITSPRIPRRAMLAGAALIALPVLGACSPARAYVEADRATFDAVAPEYRRYVEYDPALDTWQRDLRLNVLATWEARLREAEKK